MNEKNCILIVQISLVVLFDNQSKILHLRSPHWINEYEADITLPAANRHHSSHCSNGLAALLRFCTKQNEAKKKQSRYENSFYGIPMECCIAIWRQIYPYFSIWKSPNREIVLKTGSKEIQTSTKWLLFRTHQFLHEKTI